MTKNTLQEIDELAALDQEAKLAKRKEMKASLKDMQKGREILFPTEVFPEHCRKMIDAYCYCFGSRPEHYGLAMLTVAGSALGNAAWVEERGHVHPPLLYSILVDNPSTGKTPIVKTALGPVFSIEKEYRKEHAENLRGHRNGKEEVPPPLPKEIVLNEFTLESVFRVLYNNPRGTIVFRDEIRGWLSSMNQYRKGSDEVFWLENWNGSTVKINRVGSRTLFIERPFASVLGTTQPGILKNFAEGDKAANGFLARLLFSYPEDSVKQKHQNRKPDAAFQEGWHTIIRRIHALPCDQEPPKDEFDDWSLTPARIHLSSGAQALYTEFFDRNANDINDTDDEVVKAILGKFDSYCLRIALILEVLQWAENGPDMPDDTDLKKIRIEETTMQGAIKLCNYFRSTSLKVVNRLAGPVEQLPANQQVWYRSLPDEFSRQDAVDLANEVGISERTVGRIFNRKDLFKRVRQGVYWKNYV